MKVLLLTVAVLLSTQVHAATQRAKLPKNPNRAPSQSTQVAAPVATTESSSVQTKKQVRWDLKNGVSTSLMLTTADSTKYRSVSQGSTLEGAMATSKAPAVGIRYNYRGEGKTGFNLGFLWEFKREITTATINGKIENASGTQNVATTVPLTKSYSLLTPEANVTWAASDQVYWFGGLNFPVPQQTENFSGTLYGLTGMQLGGGMLVASKANVELMYRTLNLNVSDGSYDYMRLWGFCVRGQFVF